MMASSRRKFLASCMIFCFYLSQCIAEKKGNAAIEENGTLIVIVTWGDLNNTPADDVYVEAHGYNTERHTPETYVLKLIHSGHYESSLPSGIYDVFVSEGNSVPRCKRVQILHKRQVFWTLKLEDDDIYVSK